MSLATPAGRRIPLAPPEGWLTLGLVLLLCLSLAWSLDDALLVLGRDELTDFLVWPAVGGVLTAFIGATVGWGRWRTYAVGAAFAALLTPLLVGGVLIPDGAAPADLFGATAGSAVGAWRDLIVANRLSTPEFGHHLLVLGLIVWGSSMFASFVAFGHRRPVNAVLLIGVLLVANMSLTIRDQLVYLVLFSLAALFLLVRFHTFDEQSDWIRRRIGDPAAISGLYLRGGTVFIAVAVMGSMLLTSVAASAPLAGTWNDLGGRVIEWSQFLERYLPVSGSGRSIGPSFGATANIRGVWTSNADPALTWAPSAPLDDPPYLAAAVYDLFELDGWRISPAQEVDRAPDEELLDDTADALDAAGRREITVTVTPALSRSIVFTPEMPLRIDEAATVRLVGTDGYFAQLERPTSDTPYTITALIPAPEVDGGPTENRLRAAGRDYPGEISERYGQPAVPAGTFATPESRDLLGGIVARAGDNPYDLAAEMVRTLQDPARFTYDVDVRDMACSDLSIVDCFARFQRGYCEYYATTMVMMLRALGIPARFVEGFLAGELDPATGVYQVINADSHAWVQAYFPGYGWIDFDPTGGGRSALSPLPSGEPVASASVDPAASPSRAPRPDETDRDIVEPGGSVTGDPTDPRTALGSYVVVAVLLAVAVGALAIAAWRRGPRGPVTADGAYRMVTRFASWFGFAPRPNQTVYEYAGTIADILPDARAELTVVADAKVEVAYGARPLGEERLAPLREAQRRLRTSLLRLAFRRGRGRGRSRR